MILRMVVSCLCTVLFHYGYSCDKYWDRHSEVNLFCNVGPRRKRSPHLPNSLSVSHCSSTSAVVEYFQRLTIVATASTEREEHTARHKGSAARCLDRNLVKKTPITQSSDLFCVIRLSFTANVHRGGLASGIWERQ